MTLAVHDLAALDPAAVAAVEAQLVQLVGELSPGLDTSRGVVRDIVLHLAAVLVAAEEDNVDRLRRSQSLLEIAADPTLADDDAVDRVLSNFNVARQAGAAAAGQVTVVLDAAVPVVVPNGATFTAGAAAFATTAAYAVRAAASQASGETDRVLAPLGDGRYAFSVPVVAAAPGVAGMLRRGTPLAPAFAIPRFLSAAAAGDFAGGFEAETNAELLARLRRGVAARVFSNRTNVDALVHAEPAFARVLQVSTIGAGDSELARADRSIFPVLVPGRCDVYARTAALPRAAGLVKEATLVATTARGGVWQLAIGRDDAPGFYRIERVALPSALAADAGFEVVAEERGVDLSGPGWRPDIDPARPAEAAYSPFQTTLVRFLDDVTPAAGLEVGAAAGLYTVTLSALPLLADLQAFLGGRGVRPAGGDVLVRAPVPCFLSVSFEIRRPAATAAPDTVAIRAAVADTVNTRGFAGRLDSSTVAAAVQPLLPAGAVLGPIDLFGRLRRPDGTVKLLRDALSAAIAVPDEPERMVTARTVAFFLDPADVAIAVRTADTPDA